MRENVVTRVGCLESRSGWCVLFQIQDIDFRLFDLKLFSFKSRFLLGTMVKIKKKQKGDRYIIIEKPNSGMHISIHRNGHTHLKDKSGLHVDKEDITKVLLSIPGIEEKLIEKESLIVIPCEKYPACICLDLFLNPFLLEDGFVGVGLAVALFFVDDDAILDNRDDVGLP